MDSMIDARILRLTPRRVFCPLCGDWHDWEGKTLQSYSEDKPYEYECGNVTLKFWVDDDCIFIESSSSLCDKVNNCIGDVVFLEDIECDLRKPIIKFTISIYTEEIVCSGECENCGSCNLPNIGDERDDDHEFELDLEFKFEFSSRYFDKYAQSNRDKQKVLRHCEDW